MTDKQIIIDGVDVSGCENYIGVNTITSNCTLYDGYLRPCKNADCYYKNWKRKEQECETLASQLDFEVQKKECLEQECEELKKGYSELTDIVSPYMDDFTGYNEELGGFDIALCVKELMEQLDQLKAENKELKKKCNIYTCGICGNKEDCNKLYKTLTEIKEIAEEKANVNDWLALEILQKISEVE